MIDNKPRHIILYPEIEHPIINVKSRLKQQYLTLLEHFMYELERDDEVTKVRFDVFKKFLLGSQPYVRQNFSESILEIFRMRYRYPRFYNYQNIFMFDCIYLLQIDDFESLNNIGLLAKNFIDTKHHGMIDFITDKIVSSPKDLLGKNFINRDMVDCLENIRAFRVLNEKTIVFTATMSAGKSTLINALIGNNLSFTKNAACTSTILEFCSSPVYNSEYCTSIDDRKISWLYSKDVRKVTKDRKQHLIINSYFNSQLSSRKIRVIDTPGINSAVHSTHKEITLDRLRSCSADDVIVYVISVDNYGAIGDINHLQFIKNNVKFKKIIFVINMVDNCNPEDDSISEIIEDVRSDLVKIGYANPLVYPISAKAGLLFKKALINVALTNNEEYELANYIKKYKDGYYNLSGFYDVICADTIPRNGLSLKERKSYELNQLYLRTGLPQFEKVLDNIIEEDYI